MSTRRVAAVLVVLVLAAAGASAAGAAPRRPRVCGAAVAIVGTGDKLAVRAVVQRIVRSRREPARFEITLGDGAATHTFGLYLTPARLPFRVGDTLDVKLRRGGGWHKVYDAVIADAAGTPLIIASGSGGDDWADGWAVRPGPIEQRDPNPNSSQRSIRRSHGLVFTRGTTSVTVRGERCAVAKDGDRRYLVSGGAVSWDGLRPPEGVDYQTFSMIRW
ncbi:MAG: hypothetical protein KBG28_00310 [Kofleriaceae bacterium]|jgi:hypothetical protein|nr:hypothetical protein [Kofleriaceae bacterium]MBP6838633.1 hypothetical protein [Kofleriaceae bacterium]MBP9202390.1 hypothetical protein [Kofleriaceae bacterium]